VTVTPARAALAATVVSVAVLVALLLVELTKPGPRRSGSNYVDVPHFVENLAPGDIACQQETVPKDTGAAAMLVTSYNKPTPDVGVLIRTPNGRRQLASGVLRAGFVEGQNLLHFSPPVTRTTDAQLCLVDRGPRPITIGGTNVPPSIAATKNGGSTDGRMAVQWFRPGQESYLSIAGLVLSRTRYGKADFFGSWTPVLLVLLILGSIAGGIYVAVRPCD
jgi:hypothetical protein